jgi:hypothetical protein
LLLNPNAQTTWSLGRSDLKEDILEQISADYLNLLGYFTQTNVKYRPANTNPDWKSKEDGVYSDIDVIGFNPLLVRRPRVVAISCKSWQTGFCPEWEIKQITKNRKISGRERWKTYRELASPKWGHALRNKIKELTGESNFEHWIVCTWLDDGHEGRIWTHNTEFRKNLTPHLRIVPLKTIFKVTVARISTTPANSELGRLIQLLKVADPDLVG